jgi:SNF family Na+-dependent transporter
MKRRSLIAVFLLEIVTLGIYSFYWLYRTRLELIAKTNMHIPRLIIPFLPGVIFLISLTLQILLGLSHASGIVISLINTITFACIPVFVGLIIWWMWQYSKVVAVATQNTSSQAFTFWIWMLTVIASVNIIWFLVMQNKFNQLSATVPEPAYPGAQTPPVTAPQPTDNPPHKPEDQ